jgi:dGTPase
LNVKLLNIRQLSEAREESLSVFAVKSAQSRGRLRPEEPCPIRTVFQRDRDRIIYSNSFRRLKHKTQVFIAPQGDHYVTRLTHTLEVSQIARTIARALNLNEDLTEAISLGHDLGHTPFGHVGEAVLNEIYPLGFRHNEQSLRVVDVLENNGRGLNLTWEVRDGILNHSKTSDKTLKDWGQVNTLEGSLTKIADVVAYVNHDIEDAIRADVLTETDLPSYVTNLLGHSHRERINNLVSDIIEQSWDVRIGKGAERPSIIMSPSVLEATNLLRDFLFEKVYNREAAKEETERARETLKRLYAYFNKHEDRLPPDYRRNNDQRERRVIDYIAGMTDQYATQMAEQI